MMQKITTHLWFDTQAVEAVNYYVSLFPNSRIISKRVIKNTPSGDCDILEFELMGQSFMAISAGPYFKFSEAISFVIHCDTQEEIDYYWEKLSAVPEAEQCGWCKDKYGVSWQVVPSMIHEVMKEGDEDKISRLTKAFLPMKKFEIATLKNAIIGVNE